MWRLTTTNKLLFYGLLSSFKKGEHDQNSWTHYIDKRLIFCEWKTDSSMLLLLPTVTDKKAHILNKKWRLQALQHVTIKYVATTLIF